MLPSGQLDALDGVGRAGHDPLGLPANPAPRTRRDRRRAGDAPAGRLVGAVAVSGGPSVDRPRPGAPIGEASAPLAAVARLGSSEGGRSAPRTGADDRGLCDTNGAVPRSPRAARATAGRRLLSHGNRRGGRRLDDRHALAARDQQQGRHPLHGRHLGPPGRPGLSGVSRRRPDPVGDHGLERTSGTATLVGLGPIGRRPGRGHDRLASAARRTVDGRLSSPRPQGKSQRAAHGHEPVLQHVGQSPAPGRPGALGMAVRAAEEQRRIRDRPGGRPESPAAALVVSGGVGAGSLRRCDSLVSLPVGAGGSPQGGPGDVRRTPQHLGTDRPPVRQGAFRPRPLVQLQQDLRLLLPVLRNVAAPGVGSDRPRQAERVRRLGGEDTHGSLLAWGSGGDRGLCRAGRGAVARGRSHQRVQVQQLPERHLPEVRVHVPPRPALRDRQPIRSKTQPADRAPSRRAALAADGLRRFLLDRPGRQSRPGRGAEPRAVEPPVGLQLRELPSPRRIPTGDALWVVHPALERLPRLGARARFYRFDHLLQLLHLPARQGRIDGRYARMDQSHQHAGSRLGPSVGGVVGAGGCGGGTGLRIDVGSGRPGGLAGGDWRRDAGVGNRFDGRRGDAPPRDARAQSASTLRPTHPRGDRPNGLRSAALAGRVCPRRRRGLRNVRAVDPAIGILHRAIERPGGVFRRCASRVLPDPVRAGAVPRRVG